MAETEIKNRVAESTLIQLSPEDWYDTRPRFDFDLAGFLFQGLVLREIEFRQALKTHNWEQYSGGILSIHCTAEAIVPVWAYMLAAVYAAPFAAEVLFCRPESADEILFDRKIQSLQPADFIGQKVIVKGCSRHPVPLSAFVSLAAKLQPLVQSLMFGEPCSNVPLYKIKKHAER